MRRDTVDAGVILDGVDDAAARGLSDLCAQVLLRLLQRGVVDNVRGDLLGRHIGGNGDFLRLSRDIFRELFADLCGELFDGLEGERREVD